MKTYNVNLGWLDGYKAFEKDMVIVETGEEIPNVPYLDNQHLKTYEFKKDVRKLYKGYGFHTTIDKCVNSSSGRYYSNEEEYFNDSKEYIYYKIQVKDVFEDNEFDSHSYCTDSSSQYLHEQSWCKKMRIVRKLNGYEISESKVTDEYFCTIGRDKIRFFNKESNLTLEDVAKEISDKMKGVISVGGNFEETLASINFENPSVNYTYSILLREYNQVLDILKNPMRYWLNSFNEEAFFNKRDLSFVFKHYPNFDKDIFLEITGIELENKDTKR